MKFPFVERDEEKMSSQRVVTPFRSRRVLICLEPQGKMLTPHPPTHPHPEDQHSLQRIGSFTKYSCAL